MILVLFKPVTPSQVTTSRTFQITESKISYFHSLAEPQLLPCTLACGYEFHEPTVHQHPTFIAPLAGFAFRVLSEVCGGALLRKQSTY